jgi:hypothetical protein
LLDFTGNSCFSNNHHKLTVSIAKSETDATAQSILTTFFIEEEDIKENEFKKNCASPFIFISHFITSITFENVKLFTLNQFSLSRFVINSNKLFQLNCILRI